MSASSVNDVHAELAYTEADASALRKVKRIWQKLEAFRVKATKGDPQALKAYRDILEKSLTGARQTQPVEDAQAESVQFWEDYQRECEAMGLPAMEVSRGTSHQAWCEKWLPALYAEFSAAVSRMTELPSPQNFSEAKITASKMLRAYVETFKDKDG